MNIEPTGETLGATVTGIDLAKPLDDAEFREIAQALGTYGVLCFKDQDITPEEQIAFAKRVGDRHLKVSFGDGLGAKVDAIAFGAFDGPLGPALENHGGARFHLAGRLEINHWNGRVMPQLRLDDAAPA